MTETNSKSVDKTQERSDTAISDRSLRSFCEAARWGSLTRAAEQMGLGQPAISHAVSRLEQAVGLKLLNRSRTGVTPTEAGARLLETVAPAFQTIDRAIEELRTNPDGQAVTLSVSTSFAGWWLLPRLPDFKRQHPDIEVRLVATDTDFGVDMASLDLWIPLGIVERPTLETTELCAEKLVPVAAPGLAKTLSGKQPAELLAAPLLHLEERYNPRFNWQRWFSNHQVKTPSRLAGDRFNDYSLVIQAALDGQGVALGWHHIVADLLTRGLLEPLAGQMVTDRPFVIVHPSGRTLNDGAEALRTWLVETMGFESTQNLPSSRIVSQTADTNKVVSITTSGATNMRIQIDEEKCQGHNRCYALAPELVDVDDMGSAHVLNDGNVPDELKEKAQLIVDNCPEYAIEIVES